jgi:hypothetical protein
MFDLSAQGRSPSAATPTSSSSIEEGRRSRQVAAHARGLQPIRGHSHQGAPSFVVAQGNVIIRGHVRQKKGAGRFIKRGPSLAPKGL